MIASPHFVKVHHSHNPHSSHPSHRSHRSHPSHSLPVRLAPPTTLTAPTAPTAPTNHSYNSHSHQSPFRLVPLRGFGGSRHSSLVIRPSSFVPRHSSLGDFQSSSENSIDYTIFNNFFCLVLLRKFERHLLSFNT